MNYLHFLLGGLTKPELFNFVVDVLEQEFNAEERYKIFSKVRSSPAFIIPCKHCGSPDTVKCGIVHGKQRYQCKNCNKTFLRS